MQIVTVLMIKVILTNIAILINMVFLSRTNKLSMIIQKPFQVKSGSSEYPVL